jgi:hypothetical protein
VDAALVTSVAHVATTAAYAGFQATVRMLVYPQMAAVPAPAFAGYEANHTRRVSLVVGPLFAALGASTLGLLVVPGVPRTAGPAAAVLLAGLLAVTAFGAVPQHARLGAGFDVVAHGRLLRWDGVRLAVALLALAVAAATVPAVA